MSSFIRWHFLESIANVRSSVSLYRQHLSTQNCFNPLISHRCISSTALSRDLREFIDWSHHQGGEPEAHGRAWREDELRLKSWDDLHRIWHLNIKERNLLLTEMSWRKIPKDLNEQTMWGIPRGSDKEQDVHRLRYEEVKRTIRRIKRVLSERASRELNLVKRRHMFSVISAK